MAEILKAGVTYGSREENHLYVSKYRILKLSEIFVFDVRASQVKLSPTLMKMLHQ
jgi:hypothetical protein